MTIDHYGITKLDESRLSTTIPTTTYGGGPLLTNPTETLFLWRSVATGKAIGGTIAFFLSDDRLEPLWSHPARYGCEFARGGVVAAIEPDFSLWSDRPLDEQLHNVKRKRIVSRVLQGYGLHVIPNLNWSNEQSFKFCFAGIPIGAPVCATECRTAGGNDDDRRAFLDGLTEGVKQVQPQHVVIYGGTAHRYWLTGKLPQGPEYHLIDSWTDARGRVRAAQERAVREKNQLKLFGGDTWADEEATAA